MEDLSGGSRRARQEQADSGRKGSWGVKRLSQWPHGGSTISKKQKQELAGQGDEPGSPLPGGEPWRSA